MPVGDSPADAFERTIVIQAPPAPAILGELPDINAEPLSSDPSLADVPSSPIEAAVDEPGIDTKEAVADEPVSLPVAMPEKTEEEVSMSEPDETRAEEDRSSEAEPEVTADSNPSDLLPPFETDVSHLGLEPANEEHSAVNHLEEAAVEREDVFLLENEPDLPLIIEEVEAPAFVHADPDPISDASVRDSVVIEEEHHFELAEVGAMIDVEQSIEPASLNTDLSAEDASRKSQEGVVIGSLASSESGTLHNAEGRDRDNPTNGGDIPSGEMSDAEKHSLTSPNLEGSTDGRKSGLKPLPEGTLLNSRYQIVKKIGGGGMGAVYLAIDQNLGGTQRAVKEMVQSHIEEEQQAKAIEDFKRESMILSTLDHPSIPTIYDYFYDAAEGRFYLVMKYISGGDLAARLRSAPEGRIDERSVTEWALQVVDVLHYLHSLPTTIVYRDLKPSNVMIDGNTGRIMLIDFGIARSINQTQEKGVTAVGTMGYAPPELFSGQVEPRSDIYSLGSTMFHLLTGADPQNNPLLIFDFQKNPRPRQINPRLSDQIERILMRSVEYSAEARFSSALEMKLALQMHLEDLRNGNVTYGITEAPAAVSLANQNVFCGFCGQRIVATDLFCAFCGSKQPLAQHGVHSEIYSSGAVSTARLVIDGTSELIAPAYAIEKSENLVGRRDPTSNIFPEVDLSKYDPQTKISRRHARIWRDGTAFLVEDLGSSNGTILLSSVSDTLRLVPHQPHPLANGDRIRVGDTTLHFIVG